MSRLVDNESLSTSRFVSKKKKKKEMYYLNNTGINLINYRESHRKETEMRATNYSSLGVRRERKKKRIQRKFSKI